MGAGRLPKLGLANWCQVRAVRGELMAGWLAGSEVEVEDTVVLYSTVQDRG